MSLEYHDDEIPPGYRIERVPAGRRGGLRVRFPDGSCTGAVSSASIAIRKIDKHFAEQRHKTRPCLTCGGEFTSTGPGHRMCDDCRYHKREWNGV